VSWSQIWLTWLGGVLVSFGVLEGLGLSIRNHAKNLPPNDSFSETWWGWLKVVPGQGVEHWTLPHLLAAVGVLGLCLVLAGHLILGLWPGH
jgi:hypothetical protein